jgi:arsenate reductase-like glutaredoxin family protein
LVFFKIGIPLEIISQLVSVFQIDIYLKTLLNTKRRIAFRGSFVKSKEKHLTQGEKISNLKNASRNLIHRPLIICKKTLKRFSKRICKNKTSGANVVQNVK